MPASRAPCADDEREHVLPAGAERHADADLLRALRHRVRQHAVDADRREHQRDRAEDREHPAEQAELPERVEPRLLAGLHVEDRQRRIGLADLLAHRVVIDAGEPPATRIVSPVFRAGSYG